jgi:hypothetical protein
MTQDKSSETRREPIDETEMDTEGHSLMLNPTLSRDLATSRSRDVEREARDRARAKETRGR